MVLIIVVFAEFLEHVFPDLNTTQRVAFGYLAELFIKTIVEHQIITVNEPRLSHNGD